MEKMYPYAVARIRAIESNLFTDSDFEQMLDETPEQILSVLQEHKYDVDLIQKSEDFDIVLKKEYEKLFKLVKELVPEEEFANIFICKNDFYNLKVILKSKIINKNFEGIFIKGGTISIEKLQKSIDKGNYDILPEYMSIAIKEALEKYDKTKNSNYIDIILDKYTYFYMSKLADESNIQFIIDFVKKMCDIVNIKTFFRIKAIEEDFEKFEEAFIDRGDISIIVYKEAFESDDPVTCLKEQSGFQMLQLIDNDINVLDKISDNYLTECVSMAKYEALTVEPIIAYIYAKQIEIKNIRIILTGKINNIDVIHIKRRLRNSYV